LTTDSKCTLSFITVLPPKEGIVSLNLNESIYLSPDNNQVYCLPKISNSIKLINSITSNVIMYVSNVPEFEINDDNVISKYVFSDKLQLSTADISYLGTNSTDDYIYLRFQCNEYTTLTPESWESSNYASDSILITHDN
jgi:hypothetical protein